MGDFSRAVAASAVLACLAACGDPLVVVGDAPGIVRIVAGQAEVAGNELGSRATDSFVDMPRGVAVGADGVLYIADHRNSRLLAVEPSGAIEVLVDHSGRVEEPRLRRPDGIALDSAGGLLVADPSGYRVWRLDLPTGSFAPIAGTGTFGTAPDTVDALTANIDAPTGIAVAPDGRVFFSEFGGQKVRTIDADGLLVTFAGNGLPQFAGDGGPALEASLKNPAGLAIAGAVLYIADFGNNRIRTVDLGTSVIETLTGAGGSGFRGDGGPAAEALLDRPYSLAIPGSLHTLFIADTGNHRVRVVNLETLIIDTFAGTGDQSFRGDLLPAGETSLSGPRGLAVDPFNFLFIADTEHHIVRRTPVGFLTAP